MFCACVKVAELWECLTWWRGRSSELRTTSWTLTQVGFEGCRPSATPGSCECPGATFYLLHGAVEVLQEDADSVARTSNRTAYIEMGTEGREGGPK